MDMDRGGEITLTGTILSYHSTTLPPSIPLKKWMSMLSERAANKPETSMTNDSFQGLLDFQNKSLVLFIQYRLATLSLIRHSQITSLT